MPMSNTFVRFRPFVIAVQQYIFNCSHSVYHLLLHNNNNNIVNIKLL